VEAIVDNLVQSTPHGLIYVGMLGGDGKFIPKMDHLTCFFPALLTLGVMNGASTSTYKAEVHISLAKDLASTCYMMYQSFPSKLSPEIVVFEPEIKLTNDEYFALRPETLESLYLLYKHTGDSKYQDMAWDIFIAIEEQCRHPNGYAPLEHVQKPNVQMRAKMESYVLAETFKYAYLIFSDPSDERFSLNTHVLNTEAHPFRLRDHGLVFNKQQKRDSERKVTRTGL
jgi:hypothetical protein